MPPLRTSDPAEQAIPDAAQNIVGPRAMIARTGTRLSLADREPAHWPMPFGGVASTPIRMLSHPPLA